MKNYNRYVCLLLTLLLCCSVCACDNIIPQVIKSPITEPQTTEPQAKLIKIPDVEKLDVDTAKTLLAGKGLIPKVEYEYNNYYDYDLVIYTEPDIGSQVEEDTPVTLYVCKGPKYYELSDSVGYMKNVYNIDAFSWGDNGEKQTKCFYNPYVKEGYLYIPMELHCTSKYSIEFYSDFGTASINDSFDKTVPIKVIYDSKIVNNKGEVTSFKVKIPLSDLGVQKPTNIYIKFDFYVNNQRETFEAGFNLTW